MPLENRLQLPYRFTVGRKLNLTLAQLEVRTFELLIGLMIRTLL